MCHKVGHMWHIQCATQSGAHISYFRTLWVGGGRLIVVIKVCVEKGEGVNKGDIWWLGSEGEHIISVNGEDE